MSVLQWAALTAASALLAPKPKARRSLAKVSPFDLRAGRDISERFGATSGFDTIADLANYAEPIAVVFAKREDNIGGVLAAGQLVWSRAFSYGNEQGVKLMYVIGEQGLGGGIERPDLPAFTWQLHRLMAFTKTSTRFTGIAIQTPTAGSRRRIWPMAPEQHRMRVIPRPMMTSSCVPVA